MCDVKRYQEIFEEIKELDIEDAFQLAVKSESEEQKNFYKIVGNFLLQERQKEVIARNVF